MTDQERINVAKMTCAALASSQIIIIAIDDEGCFQLVTYGDTHDACRCAYVLGEAAIRAVKDTVLFHEMRG